MTGQYGVPLELIYKPSCRYLVSTCIHVHAALANHMHVLLI